VALFPGAKAESRRWPAGRFSALAGRLADRGCRVLVLGGPGEEGLTEAVAAAGAAKGNCLDLGGRTNLSGLARVLASCDALVTNDTGPMHLAAALGTPVVALEGPADVQQTRPLGSNVRLVGRFDLPCVPCVKNRCPRSGPGTELPDARKECMWLITVDEVERTVLELLEEDGSGE
jgi:heptosyltransferase-2